MAEKIKLNIKGAVKEVIYENYAPLIRDINKQIKTRTCDGQEFLGFLDLQQYPTTEYSRITKLAKKFQADANVLLVIAPYSLALQSKAALDFYFGNQYVNIDQEMQVIYVDHVLSGKEAKNLTNFLDDKSFAIHAISKTGNDVDVLTNFEILVSFLEQKMGSKNASKYVAVTTNANRGALSQIARKNEYEMFTFLDTIPEVYSSLTSVGLFPMACAGIDIGKVLNGARRANSLYTSDDLTINTAYCYAVVRNTLKMNKIDHELFVGYDNSLSALTKYWQYLFSETQSKENRSLYLDTAVFGKDISTRIQFIQEGYDKWRGNSRLFQTFAVVEKSDIDFHAGSDEEGENRFFSFPSITQNTINKHSYGSIIKTNFSIGKIRNIEIRFEDDREETIGHWIVFFQNASLMSAYLLNVNPFHSMAYDIYNTNFQDLLRQK